MLDSKFKLDDFLAVAEKYPEIGVIRRDGYYLFAYNVAFPETFADNGDGTQETRLNCRGIVFSEDGELLRLPFHKFFNVNEKEHTQLHEIKDEQVLFVKDKLDGTMIAPFFVGNELVWGSKRASDEFHVSVANYLISLEEIGVQYYRFAEELLNNHIQPIFEYHNPDEKGSVIVIQYGKAFLRAIGFRDMRTGDYISDFEIRDRYQRKYPAVEFVEQFEAKPLDQIIDEIKDKEQIEGRVVTLSKTGMVKIKTMWYVKRHKVKELFCFDHVKAQLALEAHRDLSFDDISADMDEEDVATFEEFSHKLRQDMLVVAEWVIATAKRFDNRKEFGLAMNKSCVFNSLVFPYIGKSVNENDVFEDVKRQLVNKYVGKSTKFEFWQEQVKLLKKGPRK